MGKRISPTAIGIFVVGSFALVIAAIVVVGSGKLFQKPHLFVCMFAGDVSGLKVGAAVKFKGVQVGTVEDIELVLSPEQGVLRPDVKELRLPVILAIERSLVLQRGASGAALSELGFQAMIHRGMRAQLNTESLLTGLLYVDLDLFPNQQPDFVLIPGRGNLREIPTVPTTMEAIQKQAMEAIAKLDKIDLKALVDSVTRTSNSINALTGSPAAKATLESLQRTVVNLDKTLASMRVAIDNVNTKIDPLIASLHKSSEEATATMRDTRAALQEVRAMLEPDSPLAVNLNAALDQLTDTTHSIAELTDFLQRNPAALVRGKYVPEKGREK